MKKLSTSIDKIFFIFSPFISLPLVLRGVYYQNKASLILFCICIGFVSFGYIPSDTNDKSYYIGLFQLYQNILPADFYGDFLSQKTDFIFYIILYLVAWIGFPFEFFSFLVTFTTFYLISSVFLDQSIENNTTKKQAFLFLIIAILSISLPDLLSGMRNYLSIAFIFYGIHLIHYRNKTKFAVIFILLGIITHFSSILYIAVFLIYYFFSKKFIKIIFCLSLGFIFLPKQSLLNIVSIFQLSDIYNYKANAYLTENSFLENSIAVGNLNNLIRIYITGLWFYIALAFSFLNLKSNNNHFLFFLCLMTMLNFIYSSVDLLTRYGYFGILLFLLIAFFEEDLKYRKLFIYLMLIISILSFLFNFMAVRELLVSSLFRIEFLTLPTIFFIDATTTAGIK